MSLSTVAGRSRHSKLQCVIYHRRAISHICYIFFPFDSFKVKKKKCFSQNNVNTVQELLTEKKVNIAFPSLYDVCLS